MRELEGRAEAAANATQAEPRAGAETDSRSRSDSRYLQRGRRCARGAHRERFARRRVHHDLPLEALGQRNCTHARKQEELNESSAGSRNTASTRQRGSTSWQHTSSMVRSMLRGRTWLSKQTQRGARREPGGAARGTRKRMRAPISGWPPHVTGSSCRISSQYAWKSSAQAEQTDKPNTQARMKAGPQERASSRAMRDKTTRSGKQQDT